MRIGIDVVLNFTHWLMFALAIGAIYVRVAFHANTDDDVGAVKKKDRIGFGEICLWLIGLAMLLWHLLGVQISFT